MGLKVFEYGNACGTAFYYINSTQCNSLRVIHKPYVIAPIVEALRV
jgi:hypothetical protein